VKILHTSDWHVGKAIRGRSRADEHAAVLSEIAEVAGRENVDLVVVAGDLFETAAPGPDAERIVYEALLELAAVAPVIVVAGNHDNPQRLRAVAPLLELGRVTVATSPWRPEEGGVVTVETDDGERARVALLPFVSQRGIVRADELMTGAAYEHSQAYGERLTRVVEALCAGCGDDTGGVNLMVAHLCIADAAFGGGERQAHTIFDYWVPPQCFPPTLGYVALGHMHRAQRIPGATTIRYSGSPLGLDFGEAADPKTVTVVSIQAGLPADAREVALASGRPLQSLTGTLDEVVAAAEGLDRESWLRVRLREQRRAGLADEVREAFGERGEWVVDVIVDVADEQQRSRQRRREGQSPHELFAAYCAERGIADARITSLFAGLYEEATGGDAQLAEEGVHQGAVS
jgi:exonuclease SbcD